MSCSLSEPCCSGFLTTPGLDGKVLKRFFELRGEHLYTYLAKPVPDSGAEPLRCYNVGSCECVNDDKGGFTLQGASIGARPLTFTAPSIEECNLWVEKIRNFSREKTVTLHVVGDPESFITCETTPSMVKREPQNQSMIVGKKVTTADFEPISVIGKGSYGTVMQVRKCDTGEIFAMKEMRKDVIERSNVFDRTAAEKNILQKISHPFIVKLYYAFQTERKLYLVLEFLSGGELFYHLSECGTFDLYRAKFYAASIGHAIGYMHSLNIIFRDLKPENVVLDKDGYACLTDFGLAKSNVSSAYGAQTFCGTPEYLAPEFLLGSGHGKAVDWWSLGVLLYEMIYGLPPFYSENVDEMYELILQKPLEFPDDVPITDEGKDILLRLLDRNPVERLQSLEDFVAHPFFSDINFDELLARRIAPPFKPDTSHLNFSEEFTQLDVQQEMKEEGQEGPKIAGFTYEANKDENRLAQEQFVNRPQ